MERLPTDLLASLTLAAELRATGTSWTKIAQQVGRSPETCRQWPRFYPETWRRLFRAAESRASDEAVAEARTAVRNLLINPDPKIVMGASNLLMRFGERRWLEEERAARRAPDPVAPEFLEHTRQAKEMTDAQLTAQLDHHLADRAAAAANPGPGTGDPPGPAQPE
jgi:hypothetical protein